MASNNKSLREKIYDNIAIVIICSCAAVVYPTYSVVHYFDEQDKKREVGLLQTDKQKLESNNSQLEKELEKCRQDVTTATKQGEATNVTKSDKLQVSGNYQNGNSSK